MKLFRKLKKKTGNNSQELSQTASLKEALPSAANEGALSAEFQPSAGQTSAPKPVATPIEVLPSSNVCQVCFHLDPTKAPRDGNPDAKQPSWAVLEYNVPPETHAAKAVPKSEDLIDSANRGCMHCFIVRAALNSVRPGWEEDKTILHIFLAPGVPVVVRLEFGSLVTTHMSREEAMRTYGFDVPVKFTATLIDPEKPGVEVEIYRPLSPSHTHTNGVPESGFDLSSLVRHVGFGEDIPRHAGDDTSLKFIKQHVEQCIADHDCGADKSLPVLPDRVIWIQASTPSRIQLVELKGVRAKYIALSYCWGPVSPETYLTDVGNLESRKAGINYQDLPPLLRDIVTCTRALGIEYLWVDRLCIVQGDGGDFLTQAPKMGDIYGNATLTVAAASGDSENDGILVERGTLTGPFSLDLKLDGMGTLTLMVRRRTHELGTENEGGDYGRVSTRAWIWQERLLSSRTVFFTPRALKFECHHHSVWQGYGPGVVGNSWSTHVDLASGSSHDAWLRLTTEFMKRNITHPSDRLPAIESVMRRIARNIAWSPFWGVFEEKLVESLGWSVKVHDTASGQSPCRMNPGHYAPTWSWASVDGEITYLHVLTDQHYASLSLVDPLAYELQCRDLDHATGAITMVGRYVIGGIRCIIEPNRPSREDRDDNGGMGKYRYTHKIRVSGQHPDFLFEPDVPLMPSEGDPSQPYTSSVVRVPYGAEGPTEEWTGNCLVLLVARRNKRSLGLLLGASLRDPKGATWERLGISSSIAVSVWDEQHVKRGPIRVV